MRKLLVALLLAVVFHCPAASQLLIVPDGALAPDGGLNYTVPGGGPVGTGNQMTGDCPRPSPAMNQASAPFFLRGQPYPVSYPVLWVPMWISPESANHWPNVSNPPQ